MIATLKSKPYGLLMCCDDADVKTPTVLPVKHREGAGNRETERLSSLCNVHPGSDPQALKRREREGGRRDKWRMEGERIDKSSHDGEGKSQVQGLCGLCRW